MSRKEFEASVERNIDIVLPYDPRLISQAAKLGKSYAEVAQGTKTASSWRELMLIALDDGEGDLDLAAGAKAGGSLLQKLGLAGKLGGRNPA